MNNRAAFTLIELLVYVLLLGFGAYVMISSNTVLTQWCSGMVERQHRQLQYILLEDVVMRDVIAATHDPRYWSAEQGIFRKQFLDCHRRPVAYDIRYTCSAGQCLRVQGLFDYKTNTWQKRQLNLLAQGGIKNISLKPILAVLNNQLLVQRVAVTLTFDYACSIKTYRVRSQMVPYAR